MQITIPIIMIPSKVVDLLTTQKNIFELDSGNILVKSSFAGAQPWFLTFLSVSLIEKYCDVK